MPCPRECNLWFVLGTKLLQVTRLCCFPRTIAATLERCNREIDALRLVCTVRCPLESFSLSQWRGCRFRAAPHVQVMLRTCGHAQEVAHLKDENSYLRETLHHAEALASVETLKRSNAEDAYKFLTVQSSPLRETVSVMQQQISVEARDRAAVLTSHTAMCVDALKTIAADIKRQFGYVPLHIQNRIDTVRMLLVGEGVPERMVDAV